MLFPCWLIAFYSIWLMLVTAGGHWHTVREHWPIAVTMALGSYAAGSTPMGGGTIGFPVLVLLFDQPGEIGRNFGLAVQSIGMVSASIYILSMRRTLEWRLLRPALGGAVVGTPVGAAFVAPFVPDMWVKLIFTVIWASFGIIHLIRVRELVVLKGTNSLGGRLDNSLGLLIGLSGGVVAAVTGVGIDMMVYVALVLLCRTDLKVAIPTSVVLMAFTSLTGIAANAGLAQLNPARYGIGPEVFANWVAAAPVVALGAPLGAFIVNRLPRAPTLLIVSALCLVQFLWTLMDEHVWGPALAGAGGGLLAMIALFHVMYLLGQRGRPSAAEPEDRPIRAPELRPARHVLPATAGARNGSEPGE